MRSPLAFVAAAFALGIGLGWWIKPPFLLLGIFLLAATVGLWRAKASPAAANLTFLMLIAAMGTLRAQVDAVEQPCSIASVLIQSPQPITCEGIFVSDADWVRPLHGRAHLQGWVRMTQVEQPRGWVPACGLLLVRLPLELAGGSGENQPCYGDRLRLHGEVRGPRREQADRFDEARWLWLRGACGRLTVSDPKGMTRMDSTPTLWIRARRSIADFRRRLEQLGRSLLGPVEVAYLEGLLLAHRQGMPPPISEAFRRTGTVHVLVVSGLQVSLIGSMVLIGLSVLPVPRAVRYFGMAGAMILYCTLTGSDPPILRATLMGLLFCFGKITGRETSSLNGLGLAALLIFGGDPRALADASFQLSFAAMGGLLGFSPWIGKKLQEVFGTTGLQRHLAKTLAASCGAWVSVMPVVAWHFHLVTPIALAGNLLVIPWTSLLIAVGFLLYVLALFNLKWAFPLAASFSWIASGLTWVVNRMAALPGVFWEW